MFCVRIQGDIRSFCDATTVFNHRASLVVADGQRHRRPDPQALRSPPVLVRNGVGLDLHFGSGGQGQVGPVEIDIC